MSWFDYLKSGLALQAPEDPIPSGKAYAPFGALHRSLRETAAHILPISCVRLPDTFFEP